MIDYYLLTKPKILMGNLLTFAAGFLLASRGAFDLQLFLATLIGLGLIMASACVFNNYIDRQIDQKMQRTKQRALVIGVISGPHAILFASILGICGTLTLLAFTNVLTVCVAAVGFFVYVVLYSLWKRRTTHATLIGSISGAIPPVVGYCAVSNQFDMGAAILFFMLVLWQMPHFFAIAILHYDDYAAAEIPLLPIQKGLLRTKIHMILYIVGFIATAMLLTFYNYTGFLYLGVSTTVGILWLMLGIQGFSSSNETLWGKQMFRLSLVLITAICFIIPFDIR